MNKTKKSSTKNEDISSISRETPAILASKPNSRIRKVNPLGFRVLVRLMKESDVTDAGLYLPEGAKQNMLESLLAQVIEVASAIDIDTDEEANVSGVPLGATVLIPKNAGVRVPWDDELRIIETKNILALVEEVEII